MSFILNIRLIRNKVRRFQLHFLLLLLLFNIPAILVSQVTIDPPSATIFPGVPVTLTAEYGMLAEPVNSSQPGNDWVEGPYLIGFDFYFFGNRYTDFYVGANGFVSFSSSDRTANARDAFTIPSHPNDNLKPRICIFGSFCDLDPTGSGSPHIYYRKIGSSPNCKLVIIWCQTPMSWCQSEMVTFQIVLYETSNIIETNIRQKPECLQSNNNKATIGLQDAYQSLAISPTGRNASSWTVLSGSSEAYRFLPIDRTANNYTYVSFSSPMEPIIPKDKIEYLWYENSSSDPFNKDPLVPMVVVAPQVTTDYRVETTICSEKLAPENVRVTVVDPAPNAFIPNSSVIENRTFRITGLPVESITEYKLEIYNRWGQQVFYTDNIMDSWDGSTNNNGIDLCPSDVYVWVIYYLDNGTNVTNKGTVTLIR